jgi:phosphoglycerol transferase MdoB-like AlkP superfamily enzyme
MWAFPLAAALIALVFSAFLVRQFASRRRPYQAAWAVALAMYAAASFAMFLGVLDGWTTGEYRVFWLFGAILNVPFLMMGELYLLIKRRTVADLLLVILLFLSAFATSQVRTASLTVAALSKDLPLGKDVFGDGALPYRLAQLYAYPAYMVLVAGCLWSAWRMRGREELADRFFGTLGIAAGATIVAIASGVGAGLDVVPLFSVGLALGVAVMFWGFLRVSRPVAYSSSEPRAPS